MVIGSARQYRTRSNVARSLMEWGFAAFERRQLFGSGELVGSARVQGGNARDVRLRTANDVFVNIPQGDREQLRMTIQYDGPLRAPIAEGDAVAMLVIEAPGMEPANIPVLADESVDKAGFFARIGNGFFGWFS